MSVNKLSFEAQDKKLGMSLSELQEALTSVKQTLGLAQVPGSKVTVITNLRGGIKQLIVEV